MQTSKKFQRTREDFTCDRCGILVLGDGYTNHCAHCLWSKHVDVNPGDRLALCGGLMDPIRIEGGNENHRIIHRCQTCGFERPNRVCMGDDPDAILDIIRRSSAYRRDPEFAFSKD